MRGQSFYVEVALGCSSSPCKESKSELIDQAPVMERIFIYPPDGVLVPMMHRAFSRFSSKRYLLPSLTNCLVSKVYCSFIFYEGLWVFGVIVLFARTIYCTACLYKLCFFNFHRFWLQNGMDVSLAESWPFWKFSGTSFVEHWSAI
jgi:hypothetical protein